MAIQVLTDTAHSSKLAKLECLSPVILQCTLVSGTGVRIAKTKSELESDSDGGFTFDDSNGILSLLWRGELWAITVGGTNRLKYEVME
jgi:hypothetical protein